MGLTIYYKGKLKNPDIVKLLIDEIQDIAVSMDWNYQIIDEDWSKPDTSFIDAQGYLQGHFPLKGIILKIHPRCEPLSLFFDPSGYIRNQFIMAFAKNEITWEYTKTQFAPVEVHIAIIKLLKYLSKKYFGEFDVKDEGEFWDSEDQELLVAKHASLDAFIKAFGDHLEQVLADETIPNLSLIKKIERVLSKMGGKYIEKVSINFVSLIIYTGH